MDYILNRRTVRKFDLTKKLDKDTLYTLCKYAEAAPSARNQESREYIIVDDEDIIKELSCVSQGAKMLQNCNTLIAVIGKNPHDLLTPSMQNLDLACAVENILIEATKMNIGSCFVGISPIEDRVNKCNEILNVKEGKYTFALVALGSINDNECFYDANKLKAENVHFNRL